MPWIDVPSMPGADRAAKARARAQQDSGDRGWYRIRNAADTVEAELFLYDEVGGWMGATADQFVEDLAGVTSPNLRVRVNSPGGSVFEGLAIANALRAHPANVTVQVDGLAASIASVIAMAADQVVMAPQAMLMIHEASGLCMGDSAEMAKMAEVLDVISSNIADAYAAKAGGTSDEWRSAMREETWYKAQDAVDAGLADEVMPNKPAQQDEPEEMHARYDLAAYGYAGPPAPKPAPPAVKVEEPEPAATPVALSEAIEQLLGPDLVAALRASVQAAAAPEAAAGEVTPAGNDTSRFELRGEPGPELLNLNPGAAVIASSPDPEPTPGDDDWDVIVANLTAPAPDPWAQATAHLTTPASPAATDA